jgi:hypothetical protein
MSRAIPALSGNEIIFLSWTLTQCESIKAVKVLLGVGAGARHSWCIVARMRKLPLATVTLVCWSQLALLRPPRGPAVLPSVFIMNNIKAH